jgi:hypothetical protein
MPNPFGVIKTVNVTALDLFIPYLGLLLTGAWKKREMVMLLCLRDSAFIEQCLVISLKNMHVEHICFTVILISWYLFL